MKMFVVWLSLLGVASAQTTSQTAIGGCTFQSTRYPYTLNWIVDNQSQNVYFNLTYLNFPQGSYTGVGFGSSMSAGIDVIIVSLPSGSSLPQVYDASVKGYTRPSKDTNTELQVRSASYNGGTLRAEFIRPMGGYVTSAADAYKNPSLASCITWNFITAPGTAAADGTLSKHRQAPEQQQQCNITTRCSGTIPAQFITSPGNGAWSQNTYYTQPQMYQQQQQVPMYNNMQYGMNQQQPMNGYQQQNGFQGQNGYQSQGFNNGVNGQRQNMGMNQQYGRKKRQSNTNIYGYNYDSSSVGSSGPLLVQNPNYQFIPNYLADEYQATYSQIAAQYDSTNGGRSTSRPSGSTTQAPVLTNSQQNSKNFQQIQRDSASGAYSTIAPATNIYGYVYQTPGTSAGTSIASSNPSILSRQLDSTVSPSYYSVSQRDQSLENGYNPGVQSVGNVFTGSLYNRGQGIVGSTSGATSGVFYDPSSSSSTATGTTSSTTGVQRDSTTSSTSANGVFYASANRGPQPGQIVYYDTTGRKKRSVSSPSALRFRRQVRFYDPGNNQSAMYYPYRTETDFNLNAGQAGFSQVGGSTSATNNQLSGGTTTTGAGNQRYYDTSRGVYTNTVPQFDSRGGNQYLKTAPVNPQSSNFVETLQNNARALNDYVDSSCSRQDPYWCQNYVQQIMQAQNSFQAYSNGLCSTLVASLQYSDNRCCNAVRAAGCQS